MEPIGADVGRELQRLGPEAGAAGLVVAWPRAVGEGIARHAWPAQLAADGTLHVATESSTWAFELTHLAPQLLDRLRDELPHGAPRTLRFAVGPLPSDRPGAQSPTARETFEPTSAERAAAEELVAGIADDGLREAVALTAASSLARATSEGRS
jgi:predicted nucleic acid-binding Zn ribbon protein